MPVKMRFADDAYYHLLLLTLSGPDGLSEDSRM
jgi:hypothetical protein